MKPWFLKPIRGAGSDPMYIGSKNEDNVRRHLSKLIEKEMKGHPCIQSNVNSKDTSIWLNFSTVV
jgi:hypothetical protein